MPNKIKKFLKSFKKSSPIPPVRPPSNGARLWPRFEDDKFTYVLFIILLVYIIFWIGTLIRNNLEKFSHIGLADVGAPTVTVEGQGTIHAAPNIATLQVGLVTEGADVARAQADNATKMNQLIAELKRLGIAPADLQTTVFSINPNYEFKNGRSAISGYQVSESASVKVRDLAKLGAIFGKAGALGANQVYGPTFTLDDEESLKSQARAAAIAQAMRKLRALSRDLGVRPIRLVAFSESGNRPPGPVPYERLAVGGADGVTPDISPGEVDIAVSVSITYEVK